ncbi:hypothetical protein GQX74_002303 [Glossina fuscipes]|nr:hypothetical protein GQX74_002303 [Glossina fuscipes]
MFLGKGLDILYSDKLSCWRNQRPISILDGSLRKGFRNILESTNKNAYFPVESDYIWQTDRQYNHFGMCIWSFTLYGMTFEKRISSHEFRAMAHWYMVINFAYGVDGTELIEHSGRQFGDWPIKLGRHEQEAKPFLLRHSEFGPQGEGEQGSPSPVEHSEDNMHSGRHAGGVPTNCGRQEHTACPLISRHCELGPQGDGWHDGIHLTNSLTADERIACKSSMASTERTTTLSI